MNRLLSIFCGLLLLAPHASAQRDFLQKVDSLLILLQKTKTDTNFIVRPEGRLTLRVLNNLSGAGIIATQHRQGAERQSVHLDSDMKETVTLSANYRGLSLALSINPGHIFDWYHDLEFNVNSYGNKVGLDFIYQSSRTFNGWYNDGEQENQIHKGQVRQQTVNANFYYAFNHRRFSYPAAFTQSFIQKRSAGSFIVGASYQGVHLDIHEIEVEGLPTPMNVKQIGVGVGYGYNLVTRHRWLFHFSALPSFVVWRDMNLQETEYASRGSHPLSMPNMLTVGRFAAIHYFRNQFAGITAVINHSHVGQSGTRMVDHFKWRARVLYGIRF